MNKFARFLTNMLSDKAYIRLKYYYHFGRLPNLNEPRTFNEKLQWLKLNDRDDIFTDMVDKYEAKKIVSKIIGEEYVIPTYGVWDRYDDIDFDSLPEKFVLKTTHDCSGVVICKDKNSFDRENAKVFLEKHLNFNYYYESREWPYKNIKPRILAEEFVKDGNRDYLPVYKFLCFGGEPRIIQTIQNDKQPNESIDYFDTKWELLDMRQNYPNSDKPLCRPEKLDEMCNIARMLSKGRPFLRVDLYLINGDIRFSEFTFYSDAGLAAFHPSEWDDTLGDWIMLPKKKEKKK